MLNVSFPGKNNFNIAQKYTSCDSLGWLYDTTGNFSHVLYVVSAGGVTAGAFVFAGTLWKAEPGLYKEMAKQVIKTSELKKCSLIVFERETVV